MVDQNLPALLRAPLETYQNPFFDNSRWDQFQPRVGDIFVCCPQKSGTTWMQAMCAYLIFKSPELPDLLTWLSPWYDTTSPSVDVLLEALEKQTHRRIIKTHTPFDGLPHWEGVTYVTMQRDPRDVFMSYMSFLDLFKKPAPGVGDLSDLRARFHDWLLLDLELWKREGGLSAAFTLHHLKSFWEVRDFSNVHLFRYSDFKTDLNQGMRDLAEALEVTIGEPVWPRLIEAAGFDAMKARAEKLTPGIDTGFYKDARGFFSKGQVGQWQNILNEDDLQAYTDLLAHSLTQDHIDWLDAS